MLRETLRRLFECEWYWFDGGAPQGDMNEGMLDPSSLA